MLKVNVGLSRKVSKDYNSTGFSVNLEGEVCAPLDDAELVIEKIKELYDMAEDSLNQQVDRYEGESAIASRDEEPDRGYESNFDRRIQQHQTQSVSRQTDNGKDRPQIKPDDSSPPATNKQIQFLLTLGKQRGMSKQQLESHVCGIIGRSSDVYGLTKREAGLVLDQLMNDRTSPSGRQ